MFDLSPLEKPQATVHAVRYARIEQGGFNHSALGIAAVEDGNF